MLKFYDAYINNLAKEPEEDWRELNQAMINDTWIDTSTVTTIKGQTLLGGNVYSNESVQLTSVINPSTGETLGDEVRKIIYKNYITEDKWLGKYYQFDSHNWLVTNTDTKIGALNTAILRKCNNQLKWIDNTGVLHNWSCVFQRNIGSTGIAEGSEGVPQVNADTIIQIQRNTETNSIPFNQRFLFDGHAFQTKQINNHISDSYMELYMFETQIQPNDDVVNNIAGGYGEVTPDTNEIKITPDVSKILQGDTQEFSVYNYVNGVASSDAFTITTSGPVIDTNYTLTILDENTFEIENILQSEIPLVINCTDDETGESKEITLVLSKRW